MTRGRQLHPIDERMAQRYAATLTREPGTTELGFPVMTYLNEDTGVIHLCRSPQVGICGKQSAESRRHGRLMLNPPKPWKFLPCVEMGKFQLVCTNCARHVWRQHEAIVGAR